MEKKRLLIESVTEDRNTNQVQLWPGVEDPRLRDQHDLMQFPFFSLAKRKRIEPIEYSRNGVQVTVRGVSDIGIATIWDADFLIWAASQLNEAIERKESISTRLWVVPYRFFRWAGRVHASGNVGGKSYSEFMGMLMRLQGTQITTNIKAGGRIITEVWSWIDTWKSHQDTRGHVHGVEVVLSEWFIRRIMIDRSVLAISREYFLLKGGIERWLYKIARKHCGNNDCWFFPTKTLYKKYPSGREFRKFKADLKRIVDADCLPEYHTYWDGEQERVQFMPREGSRELRQLPRALRDARGIADIRYR